MQVVIGRKKIMNTDPDGCDFCRLHANEKICGVECDSEVNGWTG